MTNLYEFWYRLAYLCFGLLCCMLVVSSYIDWYLAWMVFSLQACFEVDKLLCTEIHEGLFVSLFGSLLFACLYCYPMCVYSLWGFLVPGLRLAERNSCTQLCILSLALQFVLLLLWFTGGNQFLWGLLLQYIQSDSLVLQPKALTFVHFHASIFFGIFLLGLFPGLLQTCISVFGFSQSHIGRLRVPILAFCCLFSAWVTPGDIPSQLVCTAFSWLIFELSLFTLFLCRSKSFSST